MKCSDPSLTVMYIDVCRYESSRRSDKDKVVLEYISHIARLKIDTFKTYVITNFIPELH